MKLPQVGDRLPPFVRSTGLDNWNRFAAVNDEFIPVHMDDQAGLRAGNPTGAFGMGNLRLSYIMNMLRCWHGQAGWVSQIEVRYLALNQKGDTLSAVGTVSSVDVTGHRPTIGITFDVVNQNGVSTAPGTAVVQLAELEETV